MKPIRIAAIGAFIGTALLLPTAGQAHWRLRPATPLTPLAFTWPAVREANDWAHVRRARLGVWVPVRRARLVKRYSLHRPAYVQRRHYGHDHVSRARSYRVRDFVGYPPTGWKPLPYEFGPWNAAVVVLRRSGWH